MVARGGFGLLIGGVVLLVHDDQPEVAMGEEEGRAGSQDDAGSAGPATGRDVPPAGDCLSGMIDLYARENLSHPRFQLAAQGDFGDQIQDAFPL